MGGLKKTRRRWRYFCRGAQNLQDVVEEKYVEVVERGKKLKKRLRLPIKTKELYVISLSLSLSLMFFLYYVILVKVIMSF